jgi:hypothetical protein
VLGNDRADVSQHVIEEPSGTVADVSDRTDVLHCRMEEQEGAIQNNELETVLIDTQKLREVSGCPPCSDHAGDVAMGIQ